MKPSLVAAVAAGYVALMFAVAWVSGRRADNRGYFVGNRSSRWWVVMMAMICAAISGVTFVSVPGMVATSGFSYFQMTLGFFVGQLIVAFVLVPLFYRMQLVSIYGYLEERFGAASYRTGAWFFFISKLLGASVRLYLVCLVLQLLLFDAWGVPFAVNAGLTVLLVLLYTYQGGVKSVVWVDALKTVCLISSIVICIAVVASRLGLSPGGLVAMVRESEYSHTFFLDDVNDRRYFFKQFLAGIFALVAMTGLDQDMMQRNLSCRNRRESQKNIVISATLQTGIILLFLTLGVILYAFAERTGIALPEGTDNMFPTVATSPQMPVIVGILFVLGLVSSTFSAAGSALTALTTSFTIDILAGERRYDEVRLMRVRKRVHTAMAAAMLAVICALYTLNSTNVIDAVYTLASYTYGPILGMFAFGILTHRRVRDRWVGVVAVAAPVLCFVLQRNSERWFNGYAISYELLIINAAFTFLGLALLIQPEKK